MVVVVVEIREGGMGVGSRGVLGSFGQFVVI